MSTHTPKHLVTHFESVFAFPSYPAPGYPGRDPRSSYPKPRAQTIVSSILSAFLHCSSSSSPSSSITAPSFALPFPPHLDTKGMIFPPTLLFLFIALHHCVLNCLRLFMLLHFCVLPLLRSSPLPSPSFWVFLRGWHFSRVLSPFLSWHHLLKPFSFPLSPVIYPHHGAPKQGKSFWVSVLRDRR